jgi:hypothetical protein
MTSPSEAESDTNDKRTSGAGLVLALLGLVVAISGLWFYSAIWSADKASPEAIKQAAKGAEKQCVLMGGAYDRCKSLVGKHHATCRDKHLVSADAGGQTLDRDDYITCMESAFRREGVGS